MAHEFKSFSAPSTIAPEQFWKPLKRKAEHGGPEMRLMLAVLQDAVDCFQKYADSNDIHGRKLFSEAYAWIMSTESNRLFTFENICGVLDFDCASIRDGLHRWRAERGNENLG